MNTDRRLFFRRLVTGSASAVAVVPALTHAEPERTAFEYVVPTCPCGYLLNITVLPAEAEAAGGIMEAHLRPRTLHCHSCGRDHTVSTARRI